MAFVSVSKAALLTGKSNPTIYRHIKQGKLSKSSNGLIDTAELMRVYGDLKDIIETNENQNIVSMLHTDTDNEKWLKSQIESLQNQLKELKTESIEREKRLMALIENKASSNESIFAKLFNK